MVLTPWFPVETVLLYQATHRVNLMYAGTEILSFANKNGIICNDRFSKTNGSHKIVSDISLNVNISDEANFSYLAKEECPEMCGFREGFAKSMAQNIVHNLKLTAFAFPDERIALLLHILIMVFVW